MLRFADLTLDPAPTRRAAATESIETTRTEYLLLELLMLNPRQVLTRATIFERVWGYDFGCASNSLDVYIGYLRRKTEADGEPRLIHTSAASATYSASSELPRTADAAAAWRSR